jgi:hypothetical protein
LTYAEFHRRRQALIRLAILNRALLAIILSLGIFHHRAWLNTIYIWIIVQGLFLSRRSQGNAVVLWLRKFHVREPYPFPFHVYLSRACAGFAVPVTIQDSALPGSGEQAAARLLLRMPLELVKMVGGFAIVLAPLAYMLSLYEVSFRPGVNTLVAVLVVSAPVIFVVVRRQWRTLGVFPLDGVGSAANVQDFLVRIKTGRPKTAAGGLAVFRVADDQWRDVVTTALQHTDVLIVDVTTLTDHLLWELQQSTSCLAAKQLVVVYGLAGGVSADLPCELRNKLVDVLGRDRLEAGSRVYYPKYARPWTLATIRQNRQIFFDLQTNVIEALLSTANRGHSGSIDTNPEARVATAASEAGAAAVRRDLSRASWIVAPFSVSTWLLVVALFVSILKEIAASLW